MLGFCTAICINLSIVPNIPEVESIYEVQSELAQLTFLYYSTSNIALMNYLYIRSSNVSNKFQTDFKTNLPLMMLDIMHESLWLISYYSISDVLHMFSKQILL